MIIIFNNSINSTINNINNIKINKNYGKKEITVGNVVSIEGVCNNAIVICVAIEFAAKVYTLYSDDNRIIIYTESSVDEDTYRIYQVNVLADMLNKFKKDEKPEIKVLGDIFNDLIGTFQDNL